MTVGRRPEAAVRLLRERTVLRAVRSDVRWIGRSVGWWTVLYLLVWLGVFAIAGVESVVRLERPLAWPLPAIAAASAAVAVASAGLAGRAPPVTLDRRDLIRLGLAPVRPWRVLHWPFLRAALPRAFGGVAVGAVWTLLADRLFHHPAPWAAVSVPLLLVAHPFLAWRVYAEAGRPLARRAGTGLVATVAALLVATAVAALGRGAATPSAPDAGSGAASLASLGLLGTSPLGALVPAALLVLAVYLARRSLGTDYPPRFAPQSFVLGQLRAIRTWAALSRMSGGGGGFGPGERARLLAVLHDRPHALRPRRSLPPPPARGAAWTAVAWRALQAGYRRGPAPLLGAVGLMAGALAAAAAGSSPFFTQQAPAFALAFAAAALLGGGRYPATVPLRPLDRTRGRIVPVVGLGCIAAAVLLAASAAVGGALPVGGLGAGLVTLFAVACALEKISTWAGGGPAPETAVAAAVLAASPSFLAAALGVPEVVVPVTAIVGAVALLVPV